MRINPILPIICGYTGAGKTTYIEKLIRSKERVLIVTPHDNEWQNYAEIDMSEKKYFQFSGIKKTQAYPNIINDLNREPDFFRNAALVLDDARFYVNSNVTKSLEKILISRKQRGLDIIIAAHGLTVVPPIFFLYASHFVMFKTQDNIIKRKKDLIWFDELKQMQIRVNAHSDFHHYEIFKTQNNSFVKNGTIG